MVICKIELWPHGDETKARPLGIITLINNSTGTEEIGNYIVQLSHAGIYFGKPGCYKAGECSYKRSLSPYHLIAKALAACGIK